MKQKREGVERGVEGGVERRRVGLGIEGTLSYVYVEGDGAIGSEKESE